MKALFFSIVLAITTQALANKIEIGKYKAVGATPDSKNVVATFALNADKTVTDFTVKTPDFSLAGCTGTYDVKANDLLAKMKCPSDKLPTANVTIDVSKVTPEGLRSKDGVSVTVSIEELGGDKAEFLLKKND